MTVDILSRNIVGGLAKQLAEVAVSIIGVGGILTCVQVADTDIFRIVGIRMIAGGDESVVGVILKAALGRISDVAGCVVGVAFLVQHNIGHALLRALGHAAQLIISITQFGIICKMQTKNSPPAKAGGEQHVWGISKYSII